MNLRQDTGLFWKFFPESEHEAFTRLIILTAMLASVTTIGVVLAGYALYKLGMVLWLSAPTLPYLAPGWKSQLLFCTVLVLMAIVVAVAFVIIKDAWECIFSLHHGMRDSQERRLYEAEEKHQQHLARRRELYHQRRHLAPA